MKHRLTNVDNETLRGDCLVCGPGVPLKRRYGKQAGQVRCRTAWEGSAKTMKDGSRIAKNLILSAREEQKSVCAICQESKPLVVDHCHNSKKFRGLLCRECNLGLGYFEDNVERLAAAQEYLSPF